MTKQNKEELKKRPIRTYILRQGRMTALLVITFDNGLEGLFRSIPQTINKLLHLNVIFMGKY